MLRTLFVALCGFSLAAAMSAQTCDLTPAPPWTTSCTPPQIAGGQAVTCTVKITNTGGGTCNGMFGAAIGALDPGSVSNGPDDHCGALGSGKGGAKKEDKDDKE